MREVKDHAFYKGYYMGPIDPGLRDRAAQALDAGDTLGFLINAENVHGIELVLFNRDALRRRGLYEQALLDAWTATRTNHGRWPLVDLYGLFLSADRARLRALAPPPGKGPFTLYRGVAGHGAARRVRGLSWTASQEQAAWFANRFPTLGDPAVFVVQVQDADVLAYDNDRKEEEYVVLLPDDAKPRRVRP